MTELNILFTSSGRRVSLIKHFKKVLNKLSTNGVIVTADSKLNSPAAFISDHHELVPRVTDPTYINTLLEICKKHAINLVIPLIDTELEILSNHIEKFNNLNIKVLVSTSEINNLCFDKRITSQVITSKGFKTPEEFSIKEVVESGQGFPYLIKPAKGSSSIGVHIIHNTKELSFFSEYLSEPILQELVEGEEYTVDVLVDLNGAILTAVPRLRIETRAGEVSKGKTVRNQLIIDTCVKLVEKLPGALGCITLQCFLTPKNEVKFIEINPRFGGGYPLSIEAGADYPTYLIETLLGLESTINLDNWKDQLTMLRYDEAIFVQGNLS